MSHSQACKHGIGYGNCRCFSDHPATWLVDCRPDQAHLDLLEQAEARLRGQEQRPESDAATRPAVAAYPEERPA